MHQKVTNILTDNTEKNGSINQRKIPELMSMLHGFVVSRWTSFQSPESNVYVVTDPWPLSFQMQSKLVGKLAHGIYRKGINIVLIEPVKEDQQTTG